MKSSVKEIIHNKIIHIKTLFQYNIHIYIPQVRRKNKQL